MKYLQFLGVAIAIFLISCSSETKNNKVSDATISKQDTTTYKAGIQMEKSGGVYTLPCNVNGVKMKFILDTGASNVCISLTEALFLYKNGYLEKADILGKSTSQVADGSIVENTEIILHSIEIEGIMITDVKALVTNSIDAPLLLGQSAIQKLGKIELKGDSLYIMKKGIKPIVNTPKEGKKETTPSVESLPDPNWWDNVKAFFGSDCKIQKYLDKGASAKNNGLMELAEKYANLALECDSDSWKPYAMIGFTAYYEEEDNDLIISSYEKYKELNRDKETLYLLDSTDSLTYKGSMWKLACAYHKNGQYKEAILVAQEVLEIDPNYIIAYKLMIVSYCDLQQYIKAESWSRKLLEIPEEKEDGYFCLGYIALKQGRKSEAIRYYEKVIELDPENASALNNLANCYPYVTSYVIELKKKAAKLGSKRSIEWLKEHGYSW